MYTVNSVHDVGDGIYDVYIHHREHGETVVRFGKTLKAKSDKDGFEAGVAMKINGRDTVQQAWLRRNGHTKIKINLDL